MLITVESPHPSPLQGHTILGFLSLASFLDTDFSVGEHHSLESNNRVVDHFSLNISSYCKPTGLKSVVKGDMQELDPPPPQSNYLW